MGEGFGRVNAYVPPHTLVFAFDAGGVVAVVVVAALAEGAADVVFAVVAYHAALFGADCLQLAFAAEELCRIGVADVDAAFRAQAYAGFFGAFFPAPAAFIRVAEAVIAHVASSLITALLFGFKTFVAVVGAGAEVFLALVAGVL